MGESIGTDSGSWPRFIAALEEKLSPQVRAAWLSRMRCERDQGTVLFVSLPDTFSLNWVKDHYWDVIEETATQLGIANLHLKLGTPPDEVTSIPEPERAEPPPIPTLRTPFTSSSSVQAVANSHEPRLNARYVFSNFVVGPSNELAYTAAKTVADSQSPAYNPLVIVGDVGLGKTHLLHAIGHAVTKRRPALRVQLKTSEDFINDVIRGIQEGTMHQVRQAYRNVDFLLVDDIQFIAGKAHCQEEFFHTFNALYDTHKQIVVTSDRMPAQIPDLEQRVSSRFAWGLIADMKLPDLETRTAIVRLRAHAEGISVEETVATFLAQSVRSNMRELEGCLIRVNAIATLRKVPLTAALAREVLKGITSERAEPLTCETIVRAAATHFGQKVADLKSTKRSRPIAFSRQIAMYLCRQHTNASFPEIGSALGGKDHTTALNAFRRITERMTDPEVRSHVEEIERQILDQG